MKQGEIFTDPWGRVFKVWTEREVPKALTYYRIDGGKTRDQTWLYRYLKENGKEFLEGYKITSGLQINTMKHIIDVQGSEIALIPYEIETNKWGEISL